MPPLPVKNFHRCGFFRRSRGEREIGREARLFVRRAGGKPGAVGSLTTFAKGKKGHAGRRSLITHTTFVPVIGMDRPGVYAAQFYRRTGRSFPFVSYRYGRRRGPGRRFYLERCLIRGSAHCLQAAEPDHSNSTNIGWCTRYAFADSAPRLCLQGTTSPPAIACVAIRFPRL